MLPIEHAVEWPTAIPCDFEMHAWPHLFTATACGFNECLTPEMQCYIELGTWCGGSALLAAMKLPLAQIVCVDAWDGRGGHQYNRQVAERSLLLCQANLWEYRHRTTLVQADTLTGLHAAHQAGVVPDVIYIDADHHYDAAKADIATAITLFTSALICGDDYNEECGRAVDDLVGDRIRTHGGMFWWISN
jgi:hypothetical protein